MNCNNFWIKKITILAFLCLLFTPSGKVFSEDIQEVYKEQERLHGTETLRGMMPSNVSDFLKKTQINSNNELTLNEINHFRLLHLIKNKLWHEINNNLKKLLPLILILFVASVFREFGNNFTFNFFEKVITMSFTVVASTIIMTPLTQAISSAINVFSAVSKLLTCYAPIMAGILISGGHCFTSCTYNSFILFFANAITYFSERILSQFTKPLIILAIASPFVEYPNFSNFLLAALNFIKFILGIFVTLFVGIFTVRTSTNLALEGVGTRSLRFILGSCVPIVGKALGEAISTVRGTISLLQINVSILVLLSTILTFTPTLTKCFALYVNTNICKIICESLDLKRISQLFKNTSKIIALVTLAIISSIVIVAIATLIVINTGNQGK